MSVKNNVVGLVLALSLAVAPGAGAARSIDDGAIPQYAPIFMYAYSLFAFRPLYREVATGDWDDCLWGWYVYSDASQLQQYLDNTTNSLVIDGVEYPFQVTYSTVTKPDGVHPRVLLHVLRHPLQAGSYHAVLTVTFNADVYDGYSITPKGTTFTAERVVVVTDRGLYPQCGTSCSHDL